MSAGFDCALGKNDQERNTGLIPCDTTVVIYVTAVMMLATLI